MSRSSDPCPRSAVSHGVGLAGLAGLAVWIIVAWRHGMDGPNAGLTAIAACGIPMLLWSLLVDRVNRRPSTGIDWSHPRPLTETLPVSRVKLLGLWATWALIALCYMTAGWYWEGEYPFVMNLFAWSAPALVILSIPYVLWLDRFMVEPRDGAHAFGQWLIGGAAGDPEPGAVAGHLRAWAVKAFFLAFMISVVPGNFAEMIHWRGQDLLHSPVMLASVLIALMFTVDVAFATVGYMLTCRPLDAHIRSANPYLGGWVAALICYPPFVMMGPGGPLFYQTDTRDWAFWLADHPALLWLWGAALVILTGIYAWATVAFGLRFSNLTHRGIITHGPYRLCRHPAYLSKNAFWWLSTLPFLVVSDDMTVALRNTLLMAAVSGVYYWRARTEEKHLAADPAYRAYADWMDRHGPIGRIMMAVRGPSRQAGAAIAAE